MRWSGSVPDAQLGNILLVLLLLIGLAQLLGFLFVKLRQPKVVGPALLGRVHRQEERLNLGQVE